ncbi:MAG: PsbP-related protein [Candidatus Shapirobacteria bacterium]|nr:PsbP-related protein [Candidatus Shapirobacteria bacterium]
MNRLKRKFRLIKLISFFLILVALAVLIFFAPKIIKKSVPSKEVINPANNESISQEEYNQWKIFSDLELKYSIKYPQDWIVEKNLPTEISFYSPSRLKIKEENSNPISPNIKLTIYQPFSDFPSNPKKLNLEDWINLQNSEDIFKKININGLDAYETITSYPIRIIFLQKGDSVYNIFDSSAGNSVIQQQIVNSLEFN